MGPNAPMQASSVVSDSVTPCTAVCQAPLYMGFFRQEYWSGLPFPSGIFPTQISNLCLLNCRWILYMLGHQRNDERTDFDVNDLENADGRSGCEAEF